MACLSCGNDKQKAFRAYVPVLHLPLYPAGGSASATTHHAPHSCQSPCFPLAIPGPVTCFPGYSRWQFGLLVTSPKAHQSEGSLVRKVTGPNSNPNPNSNPILNPKVVLDLRNKEALNCFSYVHAIRPLRNSD